MASKFLPIALFIITVISFPFVVYSQQPYEGLGISDCTNQHNSTSLLGYFCNASGPTSCQAFLTFHAQPPYQSVSAISALLNSDPSLLSRLNSVSLGYTFPTNTKVIVPLTCSCAGAHYQANSSYIIKNQDTDFTIANNTLQGLTSCQALQQQNTKPTSSGYLFAGMNITVPLRCACPSNSQRLTGVKYLLSYLVESDETVFLIGQKLRVNFTGILNANGLSATDAIYPFTTLLIPLNTEPNGTQFATPSSPSPPSVTNPPPSAPPATKMSSNTYTYVGVGVAILLGLAILGAVLFYLRFKAKKKKEASKLDFLADDSKIPAKSSPTSSSELFLDYGMSETFISGMSDIGKSLKVYKFEELQTATQNFSQGCKIEGSVYRGVFNGDLAAVKMMSRDVLKEIEILKKINHFNLIRLSGLCFSHGHWYLVYEYAENGSLNNWLYNRHGSKALLSWIKRVQIALDVANGLNYLHSYTDQPYVHKDIKSSNILLDAKFRAKIANFGLARAAAEGEEGEFALTRHIVGTTGYMAPEYLEHGLISPKLDVYAFGIVMLELITGRDATSLQRGEDGFQVEDFTAALTEEEEEEVGREKLGRFIDPLMEGDYPLDSAFFMARLIEGCLRKDVGSRSSMEEIVRSLSKLHASSKITSVSAMQSFN